METTTFRRNWVWTALKILVYIIGVVLAAALSRNAYQYYKTGGIVPDGLREAGPEIYDAAMEAGAPHGVTDVAVLAENNGLSYLIAEKNGEVVVRSL